MKRTLKLLLLQLLLFTVASAQNTFPASGNAGIGTVSPQANLDFLRVYDPLQTKMLKMFYNGSWGYVPYANSFRFLDIESTEGGKVLQVNGYGVGMGYDPPVINSPDRLYINGNVGIGTNSPLEKLSVNGKIRAKEIKVEATNWPDYVFEEGYDVGTLKELENYIKTNKHLPEIPTAKEMESNGVELGEMNKALLKKIEELTLHLIEKDKQVQNQTSESKRQQAQIEGLEKGYLEIKQQLQLLEKQKNK